MDAKSGFTTWNWLFFFGGYRLTAPYGSSISLEAGSDVCLVDVKGNMSHLVLGLLKYILISMTHSRTPPGLGSTDIYIYIYMYIYIYINIDINININIIDLILYYIILLPVVPHKAVAEVSNIGNL